MEIYDSRLQETQLLSDIKTIKTETADRTNYVLPADFYFQFWKCQPFDFAGDFC